MIGLKLIQWIYRSLFERTEWDQCDRDAARLAYFRRSIEMDEQIREWRRKWLAAA